MRFAFAGRRETQFLQRFSQEIRQILTKRGHQSTPQIDPSTDMVLNFCTSSHPYASRQRPEGTFAVGVIQGHPPESDEPEAVLDCAYPLVVRTLCNAVLFTYSRTASDSRTLLITLEGGVSPIEGQPHEPEYYRQVCDRLVSMVSCTPVTDNEFDCDMPKDLRGGCSGSRQMMDASKKLAELDLLPPPFPVVEMLDEGDLCHFKRLFGSPGLSYGNFSARHDRSRFWMSASGVDKTDLSTVGRDILLVKNYNPQRNAMVISRLPDIEPLQASVDAIEHWLIYQDNPAVGGILHLHAWMDDIDVIDTTYPCGTFELGRAVADMIAKNPEPARVAVGLPNHGVTLTGSCLMAIFDRIDGQLLDDIPPV